MLRQVADSKVEKGDALASAVVQYLTSVATAGEALRAAMIRFDRRTLKRLTGGDSEMAIGAGVYDDEVTELRKRLNAVGILLIVFGGDRGDGFCAQLPLQQTIETPEMLEHVARQIRADRAKIQRAQEKSPPQGSA